MKYFIGGCILFVGAAIVGAFFLIGSPAHQRLVRFDEQRVSHLQSIQWQVIEYWQAKGKLPTELGETEDSIKGTSIPNDPQNGTPYEYAVKGENAFALCATFSLESESTENSEVRLYGLSENENWHHSAGHVCFERTIDPEIYRKQSAQPD